MSNLDHEFDDLPIPDELTSLKARADLLGLSYHPSIGVEKLKEKIASATVDTKAGGEPKIIVIDDLAETEGAFRARMRKEANELVRIRVTCMNPAKKEWEGELFTAGNSVVGTFTKFVPFNIEDGWHVPKIIYHQLVDRKCQIFHTAKDGRGNQTRQGKLIKEFAIEVLPKLTPEELQELAQRQAMAKSVD